MYVEQLTKKDLKAYKDRMYAIWMDKDATKKARKMARENFFDALEEEGKRMRNWLYD